MVILLDFFRVLTIVMAATGVGMALTIAVQYKKHSKNGALLPVHVALIGISWSLLAINTINTAIMSIHQRVTFNLVVGGFGSLFGVLALNVLIKHIQVKRTIERIDGKHNVVLAAEVSLLIERARE